MFLLAEVLLAAREEMVLAVSELLVKKETIPRESATLEGEKWCCLLAFWLRLGALRGLSLSLTSLGGHRHLSWYFWSLPICQRADTTTKVS